MTENYMKKLLEKMPIEQRKNYLIKCVVDAEEEFNLLKEVFGNEN